MKDTGAESSTEENPEAIGEPAEDPPFLNILHDGLLFPLGGGRKYGPETIATVYRPRRAADDSGHSTQRHANSRLLRRDRRLP